LGTVQWESLNAENNKTKNKPTYKNVPKTMFSAFFHEETPKIFFHVPWYGCKNVQARKPTSTEITPVLPNAAQKLLQQFEKNFEKFDTF
jgi:hypothetical protein